METTTQKLQCRVKEIDNIIEGCREMLFDGNLCDDHSTKLFDSLEKLRLISVDAVTRESLMTLHVEFYDIKNKKNGFAVDIDSPSQAPELGMYSMLPFFDMLSVDAE